MHRFIRVAPICVLASMAAAPAAGQSLDATYADEATVLIGRPAVAEAIRLAEEHDDWALERLIELTEIPAPPFLEAERGERFAELLRETGADSVWTDAEGNVIGLRRGRTGARTIGFGGHLDTVFPEGTEPRVHAALRDVLPNRLFRCVLLGPPDDVRQGLDGVAAARDLGQMRLELIKPDAGRGVTGFTETVIHHHHGRRIGRERRRPAGVAGQDSDSRADGRDRALQHVSDHFVFSASANHRFI